MLGNITVLGLPAKFALYAAVIVSAVSFSRRKYSIYIGFIAISFIALFSFYNKSLDQITLVAHVLLMITLSFSLYEAPALSSQQLIKLANLIAICLITVTVLQVTQEFGNVDLAQLIEFDVIEFDGTNLIGGGFVNPNNNSFFLFVTLLSRLFLRQQFKTNFTHDFINVVLILLILVSASRYIILGSVIMFLIAGGGFKLYLCGLFPGALIALTIPDFVTRVSSFLVLKLSTAVTKEDVITSILEHSSLQGRFKYMVEFVELNWFPFGLQSTYGNWTAPHSLLFELSFTFGLFGLLAFIMYCFVVTVKFLRYGQNARWQITGLMGAYFLLSSTFIPSTLLFTPALFITHYLLLSVLKIEK